jgi:hypothetical protein
MLKIESALWGIGTKWVDVTKCVQNLFDSCDTFFANPHDLDCDPATGVSKQLQINIAGHAPIMCPEGTVVSVVLEKMEIEHIAKPKSAFEAYQNIRRLYQHYPVNVRWAHWKSDGYERDDNGNFLRWFPEPKDQKELNDWRGKNRFKPGRLFSELQVALTALLGICPAHLQTIIHPVCVKIRNWVEAGFHTFVIERDVFTHRLHSATEIIEWERVGNDALEELNLLATSLPDYQAHVLAPPSLNAQPATQTQTSRRKRRRKHRRLRQANSAPNARDKKVAAESSALKTSKADRQRAAVKKMLPSLQSGRGLFAKEIADKFAKRHPRLKIAESTLRRHILPPLIKAGEITNTPGIGYHLSH